MTRARSLSLLANANAFTVSGSNNVGIGSTIPDAKLDVGGDILVGTAITIGSVSGIISATAFYGSGANLTDVISGVELKQDDSSVGTSITAINFSGATVSSPVSGISTVTIAKQLTIGVRVGTAVTFSITGSSFDISGRSGNVAINV